MSPVLLVPAIVLGVIVYIAVAMFTQAWASRQSWTDEMGEMLGSLLWPAFWVGVAGYRVLRPPTVGLYRIMAVLAGNPVLPAGRSRHDRYKLEYARKKLEETEAAIHEQENEIRTADIQLALLEQEGDSPAIAEKNVAVRRSRGWAVEAIERARLERIEQQAKLAALELVAREAK